MNKSSASFQPLHFAQKRPEEMVDQSARFYDQMRTRRTVRHFSQRPIPMEVVENALRAAGTAPSGANLQPWHFVVITEPDLKAQIRTAAEREEQAFYGDAPRTNGWTRSPRWGRTNTSPFSRRRRV